MWWIAYSPAQNVGRCTSECLRNLTGEKNLSSSKNSWMDVRRIAWRGGEKLIDAAELDWRMGKSLSGGLHYKRGIEMLVRSCKWLAWKSLIPIQISNPLSIITPNASLRSNGRVPVLQLMESHVPNMENSSFSPLEIQLQIRFKLGWEWRRRRFS